MSVKRYEIEFKEEAIKCLNEVRDKGQTFFNGEPIFSVRQLVAELGITNDSLYRWDKQFKAKVEKDKKTWISDDFIHGDIDVLEKAVDETFLNFGIGFYMWLGRNLNIEGGYRIPLNQLKLKIGMQLIRESGLVDTKIQ